MKRFRTFRLRHPDYSDELAKISEAIRNIRFPESGRYGHRRPDYSYLSEQDEQSKYYENRFGVCGY